LQTFEFFFPHTDAVGVVGTEDVDAEVVGVGVVELLLGIELGLFCMVGVVGTEDVGAEVVGAGVVELLLGIELGLDVHFIDSVTVQLRIVFPPINIFSSQPVSSKVP